MTDRRIPLAAAICAALQPASVALAQRAPDPTKLEPIVVTATRREVNLQDVAQSVTALSTEDIAKHAFQSLDDVAGALPSVTLVNAIPGRNDVIMRGISTGTGEYYTDSQVAVYLDDQPMTSSSQQVDVRLIDIERIEVLPGPQGTLFGSSSQSGTIRYVTNKPNFSGFSSQVDVEAGTTKGGEPSYDVSGHVNIPLSDSVALRVVGFYAHEGGYVDNVLGENLSGTATNADVVEKDWNDFEAFGGRVAARWQISPQWESSLSLVSQYSDTDGDWLTDPAIGDYKIVSFFDEYRDDDWYQASANIKGDLGFAELTATASYFDRDIAYEWDNTLYENWRTAYYGVYNGLGLYDTDYFGSTTFNDQRQNRWAYEVRLTSQGESRFQWMAGAFYEDVYDWWHYGAKVPDLTSSQAWATAQYYAYYYAYDTLYPLADSDIYYSNRFEKSIRQKALFGELSFDLTENWSVTGGARWFEFDREEVESFEVPQGLPVFDFIDGEFVLAEPTVSGGTDDDVVMKFATQYRFDDNRMVYALYSEGFRLGGKNSARAAAAGVVPEEYKPDTMENYELGFKTQWLDNRLLVNVSLFFMEWSDIQLSGDTSEDDPWWVRGTFNGGKAEQKGVELQTEWRVNNRFSIEVGGFVADPEFSEGFVTPAGNAVEKGWPMPDSPERKYWAAAEYRVPGFLIQDGEFWTRLSYSYQGEFWNSLSAIRCYNLTCLDPGDEDARADARDQIIPSWSTSTLQFGVSSNSGWDAALIIRNLFDDDSAGWMSSADYGEFFGDSRFRYRPSPQRPRSISLSFTKRW